MARWTPDDEPDDDWDDDSEAWDDEDAESLTRECPRCGADIYEDAVRCPLCGEYVTHSTSPWKDRPAWWRILGLAGIVAVIAALAFIAGW